MSEKLLEIKGLTATYETDDGVVQVLNDISLSINVGEALGLVGETGAGKTTLAKCIMQLIPKPPGVIKSGEVLYAGKDILKMNTAELRQIRGQEIAMIFQDPMTSLNPVMPVERQISEVIEVHGEAHVGKALAKAHEMLELVGIPASRGKDYPHQFSGGMKQRVVIAIALACNPKLLIADEPTTALDVTIQAQVLDMISNLKARLNTAMLLITHDLGIVAQNCDKVAIIYAGEIVESGTLREVFTTPVHPYTKGLFGSIPKLNEDIHRLSPIEGLMPDPSDLPQGCSFNPRCRQATDRCRQNNPQTQCIGGEHYVKCHLAKTGNGGV